jgi:transcriptional regulator with XRE-family HTH domain
LENWKALRDQAGLTLDQLAERSGYGVSTISGLERLGEGSARLKKKLREILAPLSTIPESAKVRSAESATSGVVMAEEAPEYLTIAECKQRIKLLEREVERLRAALHTLTAPLSSTAPLSEAQAIVKASGAAYDAAHHPKK